MQPPSMFTDAQVARMLRRERKKRGLPPYAKPGDQPAKRAPSLNEHQDRALRAFIRDMTDKNPRVSNPKIRMAFNTFMGLKVTDEMVRTRRNDMGIPAAPQRGRDRE